MGLDGQTCCVASLGDIKVMSPAELIGLDGNERLRKVGEGGKSELHQLSVKMKSGEPIILNANKGADFFEMWSVLLMAARLHNWSGDDL